ncbi:unnamed protein product [Rotaria magnacalcarata]
MALIDLLEMVDIAYDRNAGNPYQSFQSYDDQTLTFYKERRRSSFPQFDCIDGSANCTYEPAIVSCYQHKSDGIEIEWKCRSEMPKEYEFGKLSVLCAGFGYSNDSYNLNGFCRLEYHLELKDTQSSDSSTSDDHLDAKFSVTVEPLVDSLSTINQT